MGDYLRFFYHGEPVTLAWIEAGFKTISPHFAVMRDQATASVGDLLYDDDVYAELEINVRGSILYHEDVEELREQLEDAPEEDHAARARIYDVFEVATGLIAMRVADFGNVYYSERIDPFWDWLFEQRDGLLQIDDEGYYTRDGLLLSLE